MCLPLTTKQEWSLWKSLWTMRESKVTNSGCRQTPCRWWDPTCESPPKVSVKNPSFSNFFYIDVAGICWECWNSLATQTTLGFWDSMLVEGAHIFGNLGNHKSWEWPETLYRGDSSNTFTRVSFQCYPQNQQDILGFWAWIIVDISFSLSKNGMCGVWHTGVN